MPTEQPAPPDVTQRILVVEDLEDARESLRVLLQLALKREVDAVADGTQALARLAERPYSLVVTDLRMPKVNGMTLLREIHARGIPSTVIVTTGHGAVKEAVEAMKLGAYEFLTKPFDPQYLVLLVERVLRERALRDELIAVRAGLRDRYGFRGLLGRGPRMLAVFDRVATAADSPSPVLIAGESGSGTETVARALHQASAAHRTGPFVQVNCTAYHEVLLESELFGHEKGGGMGRAVQVVRAGQFEKARGGTLFLKAVDHIPLPLQAKLLKAIEDLRFTRVGGSEPVEIDTRVAASVYGSPEELVRDGKLREDLFYRLNVIRIDVPPLRDRPEDIPLLATHFAEQFAKAGERPATISPEAMDRLVGYRWPGNVRELEMAIARACVAATDGVIRPEHLPAVVTPSGDVDRPDEPGDGTSVLGEPGA